jgi:nucleotide-binding universal stress UspA family protein
MAPQRVVVGLADHQEDEPPAGHGVAGRTLAWAMRETAHGAALVVVGARSDRLGPVSRALASHAPCPVTLVRVTS